MRMRVLRLALLLVPVFVMSARRVDANSTTFSMSPNPIDVGNVLVGATQNGSGTFDGPGANYDLRLDNNGCGDWMLLTTTANTHPGSVQINVSFTPTISGLSKCTVHVSDSGTDKYSFQLQGNGQKPPKIAVSQPTNFGMVRFNNNTPNSSSQRTVTVTNNGDLNLVVSSVTISGANASSFAITSGGNSATIGGGNQHQWQITFNPNSPAGTKSANLTFVSNDPSNGGSVSVSLDGTATTANISVSPATIDFMTVSVGSSRPADITVANTNANYGGTLGVTAGQITLTNPADDPSWFSFTGCATPTASPSTCTFVPRYDVLNNTTSIVGVKCTPPAGGDDGLTHSATVTLISDSDGIAGNVLTLNCKGITSNVKAASNTVDFGPQLVTAGGGTAMTKQLVLTNTGGQAATLTFTKNSGQKNQFSVTCPGTCMTAANGGSVTIDITWTPGSEGDVYTSLDVTVSPSGAGPSISLLGHGVDKHLGPHVDTIEFPDIYRNPGDKAPTQDLMITNTGEYPLTISDIKVANDPISWSLTEPAAGVVVDPLGMKTFSVRFAPTADGKLPNDTLHILTNDVNNPDSTVTLIGNGKLPRIDVAPGNIDIGTTFAGIPTRLSLTHPGEAFTLVNEDAVSFNVRNLTVEGDGADAFRVIDMSGNDFAASDIDPGSSQQYDIVFSPKYPGDYDATVALYVDQDTVALKPVPIHGHAVYVEAYGGGGCSTGGDTGALSIVFVGGFAGLMRRRRR